MDPLQDKTVLPPPGHLSEQSRDLWRSLASRAKSPERRALLLAALESFDTAQTARKITQTEGLVIKTDRSGGLHVHPGLKVEQQARAKFVRIWRLLHFDWNQEVDGRSGGGK